MRSHRAFTAAAELVDLLVLQTGVDPCTAHEITGIVAAELAGREFAELDASTFASLLRSASARVLGQGLSFDAEAMLRELALERVVATRTGIGGCAPIRVEEMSGQLEAGVAQLLAASERREVAAHFPDRLFREVRAAIGAAKEEWR
ncbi:MAG: hypothetical protein KatS3mg077_3308 [Candidatus Binatia bacterium]|nr:MAG: hypothetical protein KatS3mg077_3308 [Candidatus Binatia bacterium]